MARATPLPLLSPVAQYLFPDGRQENVASTESLSQTLADGKRCEIMSGIMRTACIIGSLIMLAYPITGQMGLAAQGKAFCFDVGNVVGGLIPDDPIKCMPAVGTVPGTLSPVIIFQKPFLAVPPAKKAHLLATLLAVGKTIRNSSVKVESVMVSDVDNVYRRRAYSFDGKLAASLQAQLASGRITPNAAYQTLLDNLKTITFPNK